MVERSRTACREVQNEVNEERNNLERFLFNESNKISKTVIKFILEK